MTLHVANERDRANARMTLEAVIRRLEEALRLQQQREALFDKDSKTNGASEEKHV